MDHEKKYKQAWELGRFLLAFSYIFFLFFFSYLVSMCVWLHVSWYTCGSQRTTWVFRWKLHPKPPAPSLSKHCCSSENLPNDDPSPRDVQDHYHRVLKLFLRKQMHSFPVFFSHLLSGEGGSLENHLGVFLSFKPGFFSWFSLTCCTSWEVYGVQTLFIVEVGSFLLPCGCWGLKLVLSCYPTDAGD